jgi:hypothetical protein
MKRWFAAAARIGFLLLCLLAFRLASHAQTCESSGLYCHNPGETILWVNCGGEDEKPCHGGDADQGWNLLPPNTKWESTTSNDSYRCDRGLWIRINSDNSLSCISNSRSGRNIVGDSNSGYHPAWLTAAWKSQFNVIQADQPIPFAPILGTHNSYSDIWGSDYFANDFFPGSPLTTDQGMTLTDQLQYGARTIRLDPWAFREDNQIRLCHSTGVPLGNSTVQAMYDYLYPAQDTSDWEQFCHDVDWSGRPTSYNRPFIFALKEVAHWLKQHPGEFIILRLHDYAQGWGGTTVYGRVQQPDGTFSHVAAPGVDYHCWPIYRAFGDMIYHNAVDDTSTSACSGTYNQATNYGAGTTLPPDYRFPTLRELRAMNKQVLIVSAFDDQYAFPDAVCPSGFSCYGVGETTFPHSPTNLNVTGEDRSVSQMLANMSSNFSKSYVYLQDAPTIKSQLTLGYNWIETDFLGTLNLAPNLNSIAPLLGLGTFDSNAITSINYQCDDYSGSSASCNNTENRRESMIWSWYSGQAISPGPAAITTLHGEAFGSWVSEPAATTLSWLCATQETFNSYSDGSYPDAKQWYVTAANGPWQGGESACQTEKGSAWHFWHPMSAIQNIAAWNTIQSAAKGTVWINHFEGAVTALPQQISLTQTAGAPAPQTLVVTGGHGGAVTLALNNATALLNGTTYGLVNPGQFFQVAPVALYSDLDKSQKTEAEKQNTDANLYTLTPRTGSLGPGVYTFYLSLTENYTVTSADPGNVVTTPGTDVVTIPVTITIPQPVQVTIASNPPGQSVTVDGTAWTTPAVFNWEPASVHEVAAAASATSNGTLVKLLGWSDGGAADHQVTTPSSPFALTASFDISYLLSLTAGRGGALQPSPFNSSSYYHAGQSLQITATPNAGYAFAGFSGDLTGTPNPQTLVMNGPHSVGASFAALEPITIPANAYNAPVIADGKTYSTPVTFQWAMNSTHTLSFNTISPGAGEQVLLQKWSDGNMDLPRTITVNGAATYTPVFLVQWEITTQVQPAGSGQITVQTANSGGWVNDGTAVQFTAAANGGYAFGRFTGTINATTSPQTIVVNGPVDVTAHFTPAQPHINVTATAIGDTDPNLVTLTISLNNTGTGAVSPLSVSIVPNAGTGVSILSPSLPASVSLQGNAATAIPLTLNWPSSVSRIQLLVTFTGNTGAYKGSQTLNLFR